MYYLNNRLKATDTKRSRLEKPPPSQKQNPLLRKIASVMLASTIIFTGIFTFSNCDKLRRIDFEELQKIDCTAFIDTITFEHVLKEPIGTGFQVSMLPQENIVFKSDTAWHAWLNDLSLIDNYWAQELLSYPAINFSTHQLLVLVDEVYDRTGEIWGIEISEIKEYACHIEVTYHTWKQLGTPRKNVSVQAVHIVKIPATNKSVVFQQEFDNEAENVPYIFCCPQTWELHGDTMYFRGNAYLFINSIPANHVRNPCIMDIVYYTAQDSASFFVFSGWSYRYLYSPYPFGRAHYGGICNFPNFAKSWSIPQQGKKVYYREKFLLGDGHTTGPDPLYSDN